WFPECRSTMSNVWRRLHTGFMLDKGLRTGFSRSRRGGEATVIQSVDRPIRVLPALQGSRRMALSELATRLELPPSTVHGLVRTLVAHGLVVQEGGSNRYQLGRAWLRLGTLY